MNIINTVLATRIRKLQDSLKAENAISEENAKKVEELGLGNHNLYSSAIRVLVKNGTIIETNDGRYYLNQDK